MFINVRIFLFQRSSDEVSCAGTPTPNMAPCAANPRGTSDTTAKRKGGTAENPLQPTSSLRVTPRSQAKGNKQHACSERNHHYETTESY